MSLPLKYRPVSLDSFYGNEVLKAKLSAILSRDLNDIPKTILLQGSSGCGKTTLSRIISKVLAEKTSGKAEIREMNISDTRGIDQARKICNDCRIAPIARSVRIVVLNECHKATNEFWNAMLEVLEEPPNKTFFILCTTDPERILPTIRDNQRGLTLTVKPLSYNESIGLLGVILENEEVNIPDMAKEKIAIVSDGHPRKILTILDSVIDIEDDDLLIRSIDDNVGIDSPEIKDLCRALMERNWQSASNILIGLNDDTEKIRFAVLGYMQAILLNPKSKKSWARASFIIINLSEPTFYTKKPGLVNSCYLSTTE